MSKKQMAALESRGMAPTADLPFGGTWWLLSAGSQDTLLLAAVEVLREDWRLRLRETVTVGGAVG